MVEQVNNLLFNLLISGRGVLLPTVGSLFTRYVGARLQPGGRLERGVREVVYTAQERGLTLVDAIAEAAGCDRHEAAEIYDRWLAQTFADHILTIAGVGEVRQGRFVPDAALEAVLNPQGGTSLVLRRRGRVTRRVAFAVAAALVLAVAGYGYMMLRDAGAGSVPGAQDGEVVAALPVTGGPVADVSGETAEATSAAGSSGGIEAAAEQTDGLLSVHAEQQPAVHERDADAALRPADTVAAGDAAAPASPASAQERREVTVQTDLAANNTGSAARTDVVQAPLRMEPGRTYLVLGVYSTVENARRAARQTATKNPDVVPQIYRFGEKFMVSIGAYASREEATEAIRTYGSRFRGVWPYSKK